jgi:opacity protein-like surface antigen
LIYQPTTAFRITLDGRISDKQNAKDLGGERSSILEIGTTFKYNQQDKGSLQGGIKMVRINYNGNQNSALGFEMLEALKPGINFTWNVGYQRSVSKNLQLNLQYNGRKSENNRMIHSGGMEIRAFF